jgi:anthranilate synthase/indole-3-glycerol phosphate synthase/phosphoribosylanthranilate isomerase
MAETRPPPPLVKVCGVQDPESAAGAARAGADLIGMIFVPKSKRCMDVARARAVVDAIGTFRDGGGPAQLALPPLTRLMTAPAWYTSCTAQIRETLSTHRPLVVGVFMDQPVDEVNRLAGEAGIDLVQVRRPPTFQCARCPLRYRHLWLQLHGSEDAEFMRAVTKPVMKVVHVQPDTSVDEVRRSDWT